MCLLLTLNVDLVRIINKGMSYSKDLLSTKPCICCLDVLKHSLLYMNIHHRHPHSIIIRIPSLRRETHSEEEDKAQSHRTRIRIVLPTKYVCHYHVIGVSLTL